jgi:hypothetical protein
VNAMDRSGKLDFATDYEAKFTPWVYVLGEDKQVLGKGTLGVENIERILARWDF